MAVAVVFFGVELWCDVAYDGDGSFDGDEFVDVVSSDFAYFCCVLFCLCDVDVDFLWVVEGEGFGVVGEGVFEVLFESLGVFVHVFSYFYVEVSEVVYVVFWGDGEWFSSCCFEDVCLDVFWCLGYCFLYLLVDEVCCDFFF